MPEITVDLVKELRELSGGVSVLECKQALVATSGDIQQAMRALREAGKVKAQQKSTRPTKEGLLVAQTNTAGTLLALLEISCETDFVARQAGLLEFATEAGTLAVQANLSDVNQLLEHKLASGLSVEQARTDLVIKLGENIQLPRLLLVSAKSDEQLSVYLHGPSNLARIAAVALIAGSKATKELAHTIAMQVAAMQPDYSTIEEIPAAKLAQEREIFAAEIKATMQDKPEPVQQRILEQKLKTWYSQVVLVEQDSIKHPQSKIKAILQQHQAHIVKFWRWAVGDQR